MLFARHGIRPSATWQKKLGISHLFLLSANFSLGRAESRISSRPRTPLRSASGIWTAEGTSFARSQVPMLCFSVPAARLSRSVVGAGHPAPPRCLLSAKPYASSACFTGVRLPSLSDLPSERHCGAPRLARRGIRDG
ncbi:hypothetical protein C8Q79DRAFT_432143 [Trametes meyenii]|nr:hypothetical protein C8Q79DRAFT_432143 [Trametes meyenii]